MKGIVLAGGTGSRLWPITKATSKQLLPIYDKPMICYPIATLMLAGVTDILIITTPADKNSFQQLLGDGSDFGIKFSYETQAEPKGLAQAFLIGQSFLDGESCLMILGDNIFHGKGLGGDLARSLPTYGAHIFTYEVSDPTQYGILNLDSDRRPSSVVEKPQESISNLAITGLYFFDSNVSDFASEVKPSKRGELEITSVISKYLELGQLTYTQLSRGTAWLDTGNPNAMSDASAYVRVIEERTGLKIGCLEEISLRLNLISLEDFSRLSERYQKSSYGIYLNKIREEFDHNV
jgi:glucose-1-phosphate thymidylyltransferase